MGEQQSFRQRAALTLRAALPATAPVLTGYLFLGFAYGLLMASKGYGPLWSGLASALCFCGSMQYAAIGLLTTAFDPVGAFVLSLMVNARHLFYGISMLGKYKGTGKRKGFLIYTLSDETFSVNCSAQIPAEVAPADFYFAVSLLDYLYWVGASVLGGVAGSLLPFSVKGIDFVLTALFAVSFLGQAEKKENRASAAVGVGCAVVCLVLFGSANFILPAMGAILACFWLGGRKAGKEKEAENLCS